MQKYWSYMSQESHRSKGSRATWSEMASEPTTISLSSGGILPAIQEFNFALTNRLSLMISFPFPTWTHTLFRNGRIFITTWTPVMIVLSSWSIFIFCPQGWLQIWLSVCASLSQAWSSSFSHYLGDYFASTEPEKLFCRFLNYWTAKALYLRLKQLAVTPPNDPAGRINAQPLRNRQVSLSFLTSTARNLFLKYPEHSPLCFPLSDFFIVDAPHGAEYNIIHSILEIYLQTQMKKVKSMWENSLSRHGSIDHICTYHFSSIAALINNAAVLMLEQRIKFCVVDFTPHICRQLLAVTLSFWNHSCLPLKFCLEFRNSVSIK